jgi:hypothetical protein
LKKLENDMLKKIAPVFLSGLLKILNESKEEQMLSFGFDALSILAIRGI